jgi:hypothetical protein
LGKLYRNLGAIFVYFARYYDFCAIASPPEISYIAQNFCFLHKLRTMRVMNLRKDMSRPHPAAAGHPMGAPGGHRNPIPGAYHDD